MESVPLTASLAPAWEGAEISWTSSDPSAAPVSSKGAVTNLYTGTGTASVTITASWNGLSAQLYRSLPAGRPDRHGH